MAGGRDKDLRLAGGVGGTGGGALEAEGWRWSWELGVGALVVAR